MEEKDIILEQINLGEGEESSRSKIYNNDARLRTEIISAHKKTDDNTQAITDLRKELDIAKTNKKEYINLSQYKEKYDYMSKELARKDVPEELRALGQVVVYKLNTIGWKAEVFIGEDLTLWQIPECWKDFRSSSRIFDGGRADSVYGGVRIVNGGNANTVFDGDLIDCGGAN